MKGFDIENSSTGEAFDLYMFSMWDVSISNNSPHEGLASWRVSMSNISPSDGVGFEHPPCGRFDFEHVSTWDVLTSKVLHMEGVDLEQVFTWGV